MYMTYEDLCKAMKLRQTITIMRNGQVYSGLVNGLWPESGSGKDWIVTLLSGGKKMDVYVRTA